MKLFFISIGLFISSISFAQLEVLDSSERPLASGVIVSLDAYDEVPASGTFDWSLHNSGSKPLRIQSCDVVSSSGVTYGNGVENSGFNIVEGLVVGDPVYLSAGEKLGIQIRFRESSEGTYRKSLKITYLVVEDSSASKVEAESFSIEIPLQATIDLPDAPVVDEPEGEPVPSNLTGVFPSGFPTSDVVYLGGYQFYSRIYGQFTVDTNIENRIIHTVLGPLVWTYDESSQLVTLHTEWWGDLYTHKMDASADKIGASGLGNTWPYVKSEITGAVYYVDSNADMSNPLRTPYYNHRQIDGQDIGWQRSIGVDLSSAKNYYIAAETLVGQMQSILATMADLQNEFINLPVSIGSGQQTIDQKFAEVEAQFLAMHAVYTKFVFYYHRCSLAPVWAEREGKTQAYIEVATAYVNQLPGLESLAVAAYQNGQEVLYVNCVNVKTAKTNELNVLIAEEAARLAAEEAAAQEGQENPADSGGTPPSGSSGDGGNTPVTVTIANWNFNDNRVPSGASFSKEGNGRISNGRMEASARNDRPILSIAINDSVYQKLVFEYDANIGYGWDGMFQRCYAKFDNNLTYSLNSGWTDVYKQNGEVKDKHGEIRKSGYGSNNEILKYRGGIEDTRAEVVYRFKVEISDSRLVFSAKNKANGSVLFNLSLSDGDTQMKNFDSFVFSVLEYSYDGTVWMDNIKITGTK